MDTQNDFLFRFGEQKPVNASQINSLYIFIFTNTFSKIVTRIEHNINT